MFVTISCSNLSTLRPVFAEIQLIWLGSTPIISLTCLFASSILALGKSILLITAKISKLLESAKYVLAIVWAWTPWVASTTNNAPSHAARLRETS